MIYQIHIALKGFSPKIWRRIHVPSDLPVADFNKIIQTTMGWTNSHLHQFVKGGSIYSEKMEFDDFWDENRNIDYVDLTI